MWNSVFTYFIASSLPYASVAMWKTAKTKSLDLGFKMRRDLVWAAVLVAIMMISGLFASLLIAYRVSTDSRYACYVASSTSEHVLSNKGTMGAAAAGLNPSMLRQAYEAHAHKLLSRPLEEQRYVILRCTAGFGNKLRAAVGALKLAVVLDRLLILDDASYRAQELFFERPVAADIPFFYSEISHRFTENAIGRVVHIYEHNKTSWETAWGHYMRGTLESHFDYPMAYKLETPSNTVHMIQNVENDDERLSKILRFPIPLNYAEGGRAVAQFLMARAAPSFASYIRDIKANVSWDAYALRIGFHLRTCIDCGAANRIAMWSKRANATLDCARSTILKWQQQHNATPTSTLVWLATDDVIGGWRTRVGDALGDVGKLMWNSGVGSFVNSDTVADADALRLSIADFYMVGEAEAMIGTGTTFAIFAALRRDIPSKSSMLNRTGATTCSWGLQPHRDLSY